MFCRSFDMELAMFETKEEHDFVLDMIASKWLNALEYQNFIGGSRVGSDGWGWVGSGIEVDYNLRWRNGEPNNFEGNEHCLCIGHYYSTFAVIDMDCSKSVRNFICEKVELKGHNETHDDDSK